MMTNKESKEGEEKMIMELLAKKLQIHHYEKCESPDFRFSYDGKETGLEIVGYHRDKVNAADAALRQSLDRYADLLNAKGERGKQISVHIDENQIINYNAKKDEKTLFVAITAFLDGRMVFNPYVLGAESDCILPPEEKCIVVPVGMGDCEAVRNEILEDLIAKKEKRLQGYKKLPDNKSLEEYWLLIYVSDLENDYFEGTDVALEKESTFDRIYLAHKMDGIMRLK